MLAIKNNKGTSPTLPNYVPFCATPETISEVPITTTTQKSGACGPFGDEPKKTVQFFLALSTLHTLNKYLPILQEVQQSSNVIFKTKNFLKILPNEKQKR